MIVAISGDDLAVSVDLGTDHPVRTSEMVRHCVELYREAHAGVGDAVVEE